jgi:hypothetical protein
MLLCAAGKNWQQSEAAHEARVAVELGLRPGGQGLGVGLYESMSRVQQARWAGLRTGVERVTEQSSAAIYVVGYGTTVGVLFQAKHRGCGRVPRAQPLCSEVVVYLCMGALLLLTAMPWL